MDNTPDETPDPHPNLIEQSDSDSETSPKPPVFAPDGGNDAAQHHLDDGNFLHHLKYFLLNRIMLLLPVIMLQLMIPTILMNLIMKIYTKASKFGNDILVVYIGPTKSPKHLHLS